MFGKIVHDKWVQAYSEPAKSTSFNSVYFLKLLKKEFEAKKLLIDNIELIDLAQSLEAILVAFRIKFLEIFKDYDVNSVRNGICNNCGKSYKKYRKDDSYNYIKYCPYCGNAVGD